MFNIQNIRNKLFQRKQVKPELITLRKFNLLFKVIGDEEWHIFTGMAYIDISRVDWLVSEKFLKDEGFIYDSKNKCLYPITSVRFIKQELAEVIENVVPKKYYMGNNWVWYDKDDIEIYKEND